MKLYATTTSERASKGQGGNEFIEIKLMNSQKVEFATFFIAEMPDGIIIRYDIDEDVAYIEREPKGNKQKTAQACGYSGEDLPCNVCPKDGRGNCTTP
jgi:hypothetical protein